MAVLSFKQVIGMDPEEDLELTGNIEIEEIELDISDFLGRIQDRLDIQAMKQQIEILENFRKVSIAAMMPVLTFSYTADPTFVNDPFEGGWFNNTEDEWVQQGGMFSITLSISLDTLLPRSKTWVEISQRDDEIRQANIALAQMIQMAQLEIESLVLELKKSMESISTLELNVRLAERAFELAESAYNAGNRDLLDVQNAELELQKAKLKVLEEKTTYISGILDLEYAINNPDQSYQVRE
jgi:outer membrane protein TolC